MEIWHVVNPDRKEFQNPSADHSLMSRSSQRFRDRHRLTRNKPWLWTVKTPEFLKVMRPSTAGYTRFISEMYLDNTEMSISPARNEWNSHIWYEQIWGFMQKFERKCIVSSCSNSVERRSAK